MIHNVSLRVRVHMLDHSIDFSVIAIHVRWKAAKQHCTLHTKRLSRSLERAELARGKPFFGVAMLTLLMFWFLASLANHNPPISGWV